MRDPYSTLGVDRRADADTIRKQYRRLAKEFHPDVNRDPRAADRFKEINAAYDILSEEEKRKAWDEFGEASTRPGFDAEQARAWRSGGGGFGFGGGFPGAGSVDVEDLLGSLFGSAQGRTARRGQDQQVELRIDFLTSVLGGERQIVVRRPDGRTDAIRVPVPAGANPGGKIRLRGQGAPPRGGGPCGDLVVVLDIEEHPHLRRVGDDLEMDVPVTILEAVRGGSITVPTPTGEVKVNLPAGARGGVRLRLKGRGIQKKGSPGDLYLVLRPTLPTSSDPEVLAAAERIEQAYGGDVRGSLKL